MDPSKIILAKPWEVITCKAGHPCFIVLRPIYANAHKGGGRIGGPALWNSVFKIGTKHYEISPWGGCSTCGAYCFELLDLGPETFPGNFNSPLGPRQTTLQFYVRGELRNVLHPAKVIDENG